MASCSSSASKYGEVPQKDIELLLGKIPASVLDTQRRRHRLSGQLKMSFTTGEELEKVCLALIESFNTQKLSAALQAHKEEKAAAVKHETELTHAHGHDCHEEGHSHSSHSQAAPAAPAAPKEEATLVQDLGDKLMKQASLEEHKAPSVKAGQCSRGGCQAPPGAAMKACARCGAPYCSRECQVADWKAGHKTVCSSSSSASSSSSPTSAASPTAPSSSSSSSAPSLPTASAAKQKAIGAMLPNVLPELSMMAVGWQQRHGRGLLVVHAADFADWAREEQTADGQAYIEFVPEAEISQHSHSSALSSAWPRLRQYDAQQQLPLAFVDKSSFLAILARLCPAHAPLKAALRPDFADCDLLALDTNHACFYLFNFHNVDRLVKSK